MPSVFAHAVSAMAAGSWVSSTFINRKFLLLLAVCGMLPDIDVLAFNMGIPYESMWGHRGITHSILFAFVFAGVVLAVFYRSTQHSRYQKMLLFFSFFLATVSHTLLDGCTTGGLGVALFSPFDNTRYFLPWQVIKVSPIGIRNFFTERGLAVVKSELLWVGLPSFIILFCVYFYRKIKKSA